MEDGLLGIGAIMLSRSQRRLETVTANVANMSTPGFKKQRIAENFADTLGATAPVSPPRTDFTQGSLRSTTGELDLAISGTGFFQVRDQNGEMIQYQLANADKLAAYIGQLREAGRRRPLSIRFTTSKGV